MYFWLVAVGVIAYLYYERTKPVVKIDVPGVSGQITKEGEFKDGDRFADDCLPCSPIYLCFC